MRTFSLPIAVCVAALSTSVLAQGTGSAKLTVAEGFGVRSGWDLASDDAYVATRAGALESLTRIDFENKLQPSLATSWKQTTPTTWEFTLREGVKFHDSQPLNAATASNALNNLLKAAIPARAFSPKLVTSVEAVGSNVVRITTSEPSVLLPSQVASPATSILSPAAYKDGKVNPIGTGTGPFIIVEADPQQRVLVKRNDTYWGGRPALEGAEIRFVIDPDTRSTQMRTGEADIARIVAPWTVNQLKSIAKIKLEKKDNPRTTTLLLNNKKAPLSDVKVRRAIQAAVDVAGLAAGVYEGVVQPAAGPFVPGDPWAPKDAKVAYNLDRAKALIAEVGIKPGTVKLGLLAYTTRAELKDVAAVIQDQLKAVGIQVEIRLAEYKAIEPDLLSGNYDMALLSRGYLTDVAEPAGYLNADYTCGGSYNLSHYCDRETDAKVKELFQTGDVSKRHDLYRGIAEKLQADAVSVYLIHETTYDAYSVKVTGFRSHPQEYYLLTPALSVN
ncbi:MAG: ABC transporter substrate-binding protein [Proteobacteria bacterium]|nr:ABC transporter substrate-binding protein [Pseudomonadota bacterium]